MTVFRAPARCRQSAGLLRTAVPVVTGTAALAVLGAVPAAAAVQFPPGQYVMDEAGVLDSSQLSDLSSSLEQLPRETGDAAYVLYVDGVNGDPGTYLRQVGRASGLRENASILLVDVQNRTVQLDSGNPSVTDTQLSDLQSEYVIPAAPTASETASGNADWSQIGLAFGRGVDDLADGTIDGQGASGQTTSEDLAGQSGGGTAQDGSQDSGSAALTAALGAGAAAAVAGGGYLVLRNRRKNKGDDATARTGQQATGPKDPLDELTVDELRKRAGSKVVAADDAIRSSEQEVAFAMAAYGESSVETFRQDIAQAKESMQESFRLQRLLDDEKPDTEQEQRAWLKEIIGRADRVGEVLSSHADDFTRLRDLEHRIPEEIAEVESRRPDLDQRVRGAEEQLVALSSKYADSALAEIDDNAVQARDRLQFIDTALEKARTSEQSGDRSTAAMAVVAAEQAADQVVTLTDAVGKAAEHLEELVLHLRTGVGQSAQDVAEAKALLQRGSHPELAGPVAGLESALQQVKAGLATGRPDPAALLRDLEQAHRQINGPLSGVRQAREQAQHAANQLRGAMMHAQAQIDGTGDFISARRGAVGSQARSRLSQAEQLLQQASAASGSDPIAALNLAQQASKTAERASELAQQDVNGFGGMGGYGPYAGGYAPGRRRSSSGSFAGGLGGAILGGILMNSLLGGDNDHSDWGGGGFGGFGGGGLGGGDFGGFDGGIGGNF